MYYVIIFGVLQGSVIFFGDYADGGHGETRQTDGQAAPGNPDSPQRSLSKATEEGGLSGPF